jgi:hypothetical protein
VVLASVKHADSEQSGPKNFWLLSFSKKKKSLLWIFFGNKTVISGHFGTWAWLLDGPGWLLDRLKIDPKLHFFNFSLGSVLQKCHFCHKVTWKVLFGENKKTICSFVTTHFFVTTYF